MGVREHTTDLAPSFHIVTPSHSIDSSVILQKRERYQGVPHDSGVQKQNRLTPRAHGAYLHSYACVKSLKICRSKLWRQKSRIWNHGAFKRIASKSSTHSQTRNSTEL